MSYNPQNPNGSATSANSSPVVVASDQSAIPVSGTVTTNAGTNLNTSALALETGGNLATVANTVGTVAPGTAGTKSQLGGGVYNSTPPTLTNGQQTALQLDNDGSLQVSVRDMVALPANQSVNVSQINAHTVVEGGVNGSQSVGGPTASGASLTANPLTIGGLAKTAEPTAVTDGQVVNVLLSKAGKPVIRHALREMISNQQTTITSSTSETTIITADATYLLDLYGLILTNTSTTNTKVTIKDATAGTTRAVIYVPPGDTRGFMLPASDGHKQAATVNNNWTATCGTSVASIEVTAMFAKALP